MTVLVTYNPSDQKRRRRIARISQGAIARILGISVSTISEYENEKDKLPWLLTGEDYERALLQAIQDKRNEESK
jgi:predicted transcriptional regulator